MARHAFRSILQAAVVVALTVGPVAVMAETWRVGLHSAGKLQIGTDLEQLPVSLQQPLVRTELDPSGVLPGPTKSRGVGDFVEGMARSSDKSFEQVEAEFFENMRPTSLIKRFASPQEVASLVAYVASPVASATTGAALRVDGGVVKSAF